MATWAEIKAAIEAAGVKDDDEVNWVDFVGLPDYVERAELVYPGTDIAPGWIIS